VQPDAAALARARSELAQASGKRRLDLILDAPDPGALVRALPADELYFTIRDIGLADAVELVQMASPSQFRVFLDLEAWRRDEPAPARAYPWIRAARAGAGRDDLLDRAWRRKLAALDIELLELLLHAGLRVHDLDEEPDPVIAGEHFLRMPDGRLIVEFLVEGTDYLAVRGLVDDLLAEDPFRAGRLLSALRYELPSELAETALRWRSGRLQDLGYPPLGEALSWFARPAGRAAGKLPGAPSRPPGFFLEWRPRGSRLARAADRLPGEERQALELELVTAANAVLVADGVDPSDLEGVRRSVEAARALVELGLEAVAGEDDGRAAEALSTQPVKALFQRGFARLLELKWRAEKVRAALAGRELGPPLDELIDALARKRPLYFPGVEAARDDWGTPAAGAFAPRPFLTSEDLGRAGEALRQAEERARAT
jgi:hypothetical protein